MDPVDALGWIAAASSALAALPQLVRLVRYGRTGGLSRFALQLILSTNIAWTFHALAGALPNLVVANVLLGSLITAILWKTVRLRGQNPVVALGVPLATGLALVVVHESLGPAWFGSLAAVTAVLAQLGQSREIVRAPSLSGLSPLYLAWMVINQLNWLGWGILFPDLPIVISASTMLVVTLFNLSWYWLRRVREGWAG